MSWWRAWGAHRAGRGGACQLLRTHARAGACRQALRSAARTRGKEQQALKAEAKARVRHGAVAAQVQVAGVRLQGHARVCGRERSIGEKGEEGDP